MKFLEKNAFGEEQEIELMTMEKGSKKNIVLNYKYLNEIY